jgi:hypothetical protein
MCFFCDPACTVCNINSSYCSVCNPGNFYFLNHCGTICPNPYFMDVALNNCSLCDLSCSACANSSTNCSACYNGYFYLSQNMSCPTSCPTDFMIDLTTNYCIDCTTASNCVGLTISIYLQSATLTSPIYVDLNFTQNLNFTTFPYKTFQNLTFQTINLSMFKVSYNITGTNSYRIILIPQGTGMIYG